MKRDKLTFLIAELILIVLAAFFIHKIFQEDVAQKRDRKSTRLNSSHPTTSRMPSSA